MAETSYQSTFLLYSDTPRWQFFREILLFKDLGIAFTAQKATCNPKLLYLLMSRCQDVITNGKHNIFYDSYFYDDCIHNVKYMSTIDLKLQDFLASLLIVVGSKTIRLFLHNPSSKNTWQMCKPMELMLVDG